MKKDLHPEMIKSTIKCACGANFETMSNKDSHMLEVCNNCHPAYNENIRTTHKKTGAVEKFNRKFNLKQEDPKPKVEVKEEKIKITPEPVVEEVIEETPEVAEEATEEVTEETTEEVVEEVTEDNQPEE